MNHHSVKDTLQTDYGDFGFIFHLTLLLDLAHQHGQLLLEESFVING